jgi:hypothetical protein
LRAALLELEGMHEVERRIDASVSALVDAQLALSVSACL